MATLDSAPTQASLPSALVRRSHEFDQQQSFALDGKTLCELKEIDTLNKDAKTSLLEMKEKSAVIYSLPSIVAMPIIANDEKIENEWRKTMEEPLPVYFNPDGTRTEQALQ